MPKKNPSPPTERRCLRCYCSDRHACPGGCDWVGHANVCTRCLTPLERAHYNGLLTQLNDAARGAYVAMEALKRAEAMIASFEKLLSGGQNRKVKR